jgi:hypothetical protein
MLQQRQSLVNVRRVSEADNILIERQLNADVPAKLALTILHKPISNCALEPRLLNCQLLLARELFGDREDVTVQGNNPCDEAVAVKSGCCFENAEAVNFQSCSPVFCVFLNCRWKASRWQRMKPKAPTLQVST